MALLTFTGSVAKGTAKPMTLNKSSLTAAITAVTSDAYWTDTDHIARAVVYYESSGGQQKRLTYDFTQASPTADLLISAKGRDEWRVTKVQLFNFDGGSLTIPEAVLQAQVPGGISGINLNLGGVIGNGTARSLFSGPVLGGSASNWTSDTYSYTVLNGVMTLTLSLVSNVAGNTINSGGPGGTYSIALPAGYNFAPSVTGANLIHNSQSWIYGYETVLADVSMYSSSSSTTHTRKLYRAASSPASMVIFYPVWTPVSGWSWGYVNSLPWSEDGAEAYARYLTGNQNVNITFTATIPVVAV